VFLWLVFLVRTDVIRATIASLMYKYLKRARTDDYILSTIQQRWKHFSTLGCSVIFEHSQIEYFQFLTYELVILNTWVELLSFLSILDDNQI
jgi:hypothetical protein